MTLTLLRLIVLAIVVAIVPAPVLASPLMAGQCCDGKPCPMSGSGKPCCTFKPAPDQTNVASERVKLERPNPSSVVPVLASAPILMLAVAMPSGSPLFARADSPPLSLPLRV